MKFTFNNKTLDRKDIHNDDFADILEAVAPYYMLMVVGGIEVSRKIICTYSRREFTGP